MRSVIDVVKAQEANINLPRLSTVAQKLVQTRNLVVRPSTILEMRRANLSAQYIIDVLAYSPMVDGTIYEYWTIRVGGKVHSIFCIEKSIEEVQSLTLANLTETSVEDGLLNIWVLKRTVPETFLALEIAIRYGLFVSKVKRILIEVSETDTVLPETLNGLGFERLGEDYIGTNRIVVFAFGDSLVSRLKEC